MKLSNPELAKIYEDISRHPRFVSDDSLNKLAQHINCLDEEIERQRALVDELADLVEQETARVKQKHELIERADEIISMSLPMTERYGGRQWLKDVERGGD